MAGFGSWVQEHLPRWASEPFFGQSELLWRILLPAASIQLRPSLVYQLCKQRQWLLQNDLVYSSTVLDDNNLKRSAVRANHVSPGFCGLICFLGAVQVYRALKSGVQVVAAKVFQDRDPNSSGSLLSSSRASTARMDVFKQEIAILKSCHDRNIVQFIGACLQPDCTIMVMEYLEGGDLYHAIANDSTGRFSWYRR